MIVADCEGCLAEFIKMMGNDFNKINKVIFERDMEYINGKLNCDYEEIIKKLKAYGFDEIEKKFNIVNRYV